MDQEAASRGDQTRAQICQAAYQLFVSQGYHGTSMRQITERAGIALSGFYNHFASKEELFLQVLSDHHPIRELLPELDAAKGDTTEDFIRNTAHRMVQKFKGRNDFLNLMFIELVEFNGQHVPGLFQRYYPSALQLVQRLFNISEELRPIPPPILLRAFIGLFFSYVVTELLIGGHIPREMEQNTLDYFVDIFLHGILSGGEAV